MKIAIVKDQKSKYKNPVEAKKSDDHATSVANEVKKVLDKKYEIEIFEFNDDLIDNLRKNNIDLVFNLANGNGGEDSLSQLPNLLEKENIPYTASGPEGHGVCYNKILSSSLLSKNNINTPEFLAASKIEEIDNVHFSYPLIVKPKDEGSSRGIHNDSFVTNLEDLKVLLENLLSKYRPPILINEFIDGVEMTVGVIGNPPDLEVLPILEIDFSDLPPELNKIYSFEVKYDYEDSTNFHIPARISEELKEKIEKIAKSAFELLGLRDYARIDFRVKDQTPYIIEINSLPGLNPEYSDIIKMYKASGRTYGDLVFRIVDTARKRYNL